ncbi:protein of unknown function [Acidithiobacillus ferrivorans]|uniref:Uncharacterized protein n=1 Tax=Acidithiobacillus ferrivorans TaxID=160808 RepID=A0A060UP11_9PROT|nr:hypothetical protein AFERRI_40147 [Acidithiobacillus ferrivorans]SMH64154.1 protein of unknown function [Acidithiobacillus ferrivorans]
MLNSRWADRVLRVLSWVAQAERQAGEWGMLWHSGCIEGELWRKTPGNVRSTRMSGCYGS